MNRIITFILIIVIFALSLFLRFYNLGNIPPSLDWDEASLGFNAYTILKTGKDEYGNRLPISIRSFNDYKASVYVYLSTIPIALFGLSEFSIRFASATLGSLTVLVVFFIIRSLIDLDDNFKKYSLLLALLTMFFLAISPWHLQFSRVAFEANVALFFFCLANLLLILSFDKQILLPLSVLLYGVSMFTYHSYKITVPIFAALLLFYFKNKIFKKNLFTVCSALIIFFLILLLFYSSRLGGQSRFFSTSIFQQGGSAVNIFNEFIRNYLVHYDINFLFIKGDPQDRHHALTFAQIYLWELPFVVAGIIFLIKKKIKNKAIMFIWFVTAPLAAAVTRDVPNAVRSLVFLPTFQFFTSLGIFSLYLSLKRNIFKKILIFFVSIFCLSSFIYYLHMYYIHDPIENSQSWLYGYKQIVDYVNKHGRDYQKIIVTTHYDQPYIYFLFYQKPLKILVNSGEFYKGFGNLEFRRINWQTDKDLKNTLLIGTPAEIPINQNKVKEIKFLDGKTAFRIVAL